MTKKRFLLGKKGSNEMLVIELNPNTANEDNLDPTSRNIQTIAQNNVCDAWWLINLYAQRIRKPSNLPKKVNQVIAKENIDFITELIMNGIFTGKYQEAIIKEPKLYLQK